MYGYRLIVNMLMVIYISRLHDTLRGDDDYNSNYDELASDGIILDIEFCKERYGAASHSYLNVIPKGNSHNH